MLAITPEVADIVETPSRERGVNCSFYTLGEVGVKVYYDENAAKLTHELQSIAYDYGIAPKVLSDVLTYTNKFGVTKYIYFTELAEVEGYRIIKEADNNVSKINQLRVESYNSDAYYKLKQDMRHLSDMDERFYDAYSDLHWKNWGWVEGKAVCIDFAAC